MTTTPDRVKHYDAVALAAATDGMTVAEFAEMKRDAERYRWLKAEAYEAYPDMFYAERVFLIVNREGLGGQDIVNIDAAIDAQILNSSRG